METKYAYGDHMTSLTPYGTPNNQPTPPVYQTPIVQSHRNCPIVQSHRKAPIVESRRKPSIEFRQSPAIYGG